MISIEEKLTSKVPGLTSLFVSFDYNKEIIEIIKALPCKNYSKVTKTWEVPVTYLSELLDRLCFIDDINVKLYDYIVDEENVYTLSKYKTHPYPYQLDGIQYGLNHNKWLLLDEPGLGKTLQIIYLAYELKKRDKLKHCLIVCGINNLKTNWKKEIDKHSNLTSTILGEYNTRKGNLRFGGNKEKLKHLKSDIKEFFVIVNIEALRDDNIIKELKKQQDNYQMIVVDEIHTCKSDSSQQGKNLLKLTDAKYLVGATGTLMLNDPLDVYVPFKWAGIDKSTLTNFKNYYCIYGGKFGNDFLGYHNLDIIKKQLQLFSLRRKKDLLDLPEKNVITEYVDMSDKQTQFYEDVVNGVKSEVDKVKLTYTDTLALILRLRQATACPSILTTSDVPSVKIERACELTEQLVKTGEKVVIFSTFKDTVNVLKDKLSKYNPVIGTGETDDVELSTSIDMFQQDNEHQVFIGTWQKCGTGLTLNRARYMIFIDTPWTDGAFKQACDRIHRIGSKNPVFIYNLVCTNTVDEKVLSIITDKKALSEFVVDNEITKDSIASLKKYICELR
jgi:SNF2 family DNA or RNA helicase